MKKRTDYVSNSSSSSFIVVPREMREIKVVSELRDGDSSNRTMDVGKLHRRLRELMENQVGDKPWNGLVDSGEKRFGWQVCDYDDIGSKWNWLVLQAYYSYSMKFREVIDVYLHGIFPDFSMDWGGMAKFIDIDAYIDHASIDPDGTFEEIGRVGIDRWLLDAECRIHNDNDNHE